MLVCRIGAYLDVRAQELRNGVNRWKENMHHDKDGPQLVASSSSAASTRGQPETMLVTQRSPAGLEGASQQAMPMVQPLLGGGPEGSQQPLPQTQRLLVGSEI